MAADATASETSFAKAGMNLLSIPNKVCIESYRHIPFPTLDLGGRADTMPVGRGQLFTEYVDGSRIGEDLVAMSTRRHSATEELRAIELCTSTHSSSSVSGST